MKRSRIRCSEMTVYLCENLAEDLNSPRCRALKKHLAECPNCTAYLDSLKKTVYLFRTIHDPSLPSKVRKRLRMIVNLAETTRPPFRKARKRA